ncbi:hypothetical protein LOK49_LG02G01382 [Camellia lanceoleosa]|uniref:Uncharacterized protein n=1 Tax=Camellia lanceoleosa TaxID=1840588 RepID=A0ACC0ISE8_9ERIC|nr:hypothetical protein LOK49_LG02G01382 [Camellia lanceoleosa]
MIQNLLFLLLLLLLRRFGIVGFEPQIYRRRCRSEIEERKSVGGDWHDSVVALAAVGDGGGNATNDYSAAFGKSDKAKWG